MSRVSSECFYISAIATDCSRNDKEKSKPSEKSEKIEMATANALCVQLGSLSTTLEMATGDPTFCTKCEAALSSISKVKDGKWDCGESFSVHFNSLIII